MNGTVFTPPAVNLAKRVNGYLLGSNNKETTMSRNVSDISQMILFRPENYIWENGTDNYGYAHSIECEYPKKHYNRISAEQLRYGIWNRVEDHYNTATRSFEMDKNYLEEIKNSIWTIPDAILEDLITVMCDVEKIIPRKDIVMVAWQTRLTWKEEGVINVWFRYKETDLTIFKVEYHFENNKYIEGERVEIKMLSPCVVQNGGLTHLDVEYMQTDALYRQTFQTYAASSEESFVASWKGMQKWEAKMRATYGKTVQEAQALEKKANNIARACNIEM